MEYIPTKNFKDFCVNQDRLIEILNHRMTGIEKSMFSIRTDITWLKKLLFVIAGLLGTMFITLLIKSVIGG